MPHKTFDVVSLKGLLEKTLEVKTGLDNDRFLWFRGANCDQNPLLPSLMRDGKSSEAVFDREARLVTRFRQRSLPFWPHGYHQDDWEHLFAMQHYGIPTRLLDWSENLFVAAHFALQPHRTPHEGSAGELVHEGPCVPSIWIVDPIGWNRQTPLGVEYGEDTYVLTTVHEDSEGYRPDTKKKRPTTPMAIFGPTTSSG